MKQDIYSRALIEVLITGSILLLLWYSIIKHLIYLYILCKLVDHKHHSKWHRRKSWQLVDKIVHWDNLKNKQKLAKWVPFVFKIRLRGNKSETVSILISISLSVIEYIEEKWDWDQKWDRLAFMAPEPDLENYSLIFPIFSGQIWRCLQWADPRAHRVPPSGRWVSNRLDFQHRQCNWLL